MKILLIIQIISYLIYPDSEFHRSYVNVIIPLMNIIQLHFPEINNRNNHRDVGDNEMRLISPDENGGAAENGENNTSYNNHSGGGDGFDDDAQGDISKKYTKKK